jgi:hypothetical protein
MEDAVDEFLTDEQPSPRKLIDVELFSNWRRLVRSLSWAILYIDKFYRKKAVNIIISAEYELKAERLVIRQAQAELLRNLPLRPHDNQYWSSTGKALGCNFYMF